MTPLVHDLLDLDRLASGQLRIDGRAWLLAVPAADGRVERLDSRPARYVATGDDA